MLPEFKILRDSIAAVIKGREQQGHITDGLLEELEAIPDSYDRLWELAKRLPDLPMRRDWPYREPNDLEEIWRECDPGRPLGFVGKTDIYDDVENITRRLETAFLSAVCGCILGKPVEVNPSLADIQHALESIGEWPMNDYISDRAKEALPRVSSSWNTTTRENIKYVAPDDDINYIILGMLLLEEHGINFTKEDIQTAWLRHLPIAITFGPERNILLKAGASTLGESTDGDKFNNWVNILNPKDEYCGALIRVDAYGYACPGRPALAAELAWRDSGWTHRRTGIYGSMFVAAAISLAFVMDDPLEIFNTALKFVPVKSRFYKVVEKSLEEISKADDWMDGYNRIHNKYSQYTHCQIYQEIGTMINTLKFAENIGDGICKQVSQGNDTDSFGTTAGSILGAFFGPGHLEERWYRVFNDDIRTGLAFFYERSLDTLQKRIAKLPWVIANDIRAK